MILYWAAWAAQNDCVWMLTAAYFVGVFFGAVAGGAATLIFLRSNR